MRKNLLEKASYKVWDSLLREVEKYPNTTLRVMKGLKESNWMCDLKFEDADWLSKEVLKQDKFSYGDIFNLFRHEK